LGWWDCWCHVGAIVVPQEAAEQQDGVDPEAQTQKTPLKARSKLPEKNGERGKLGQERLEVGWEAVMFLFNIVNLNV